MSDIHNAISDFKKDFNKVVRLEHEISQTTVWFEAVNRKLGEARKNSEKEQLTRKLTEATTKLNGEKKKRLTLPYDDIKSTYGDVLKLAEELAEAGDSTHNTVLKDLNINVEGKMKQILGRKPSVEITKLMKEMEALGKITIVNPPKKEATKTKIASPTDNDAGSGPKGDGQLELEFKELPFHDIDLMVKAPSAASANSNVLPNSKSDDSNNNANKNIATTTNSTTSSTSSALLEFGKQLISKSSPASAPAAFMESRTISQEREHPHVHKLSGIEVRGYY
jgi:hypothetical protein